VGREEDEQKCKSRESKIIVMEKGECKKKKKKKDKEEMVWTGLM
jgi:hypothetical protein